MEVPSPDAVIDVKDDLLASGMSIVDISEFKDKFTTANCKCRPQKVFTQSIPVQLKRLSESAVIPTYGSEYAACFDLYASESAYIYPSKVAIVPTGWSVEIPSNTKLYIKTRSGMSTKGVIVANAPGVVDSDYRGEVKIVLINLSDQPYEIKAGDRIAQGEVVPFLQSHFLEVDQLSDTARGAGGLGSTGK